MTDRDIHQTPGPDEGLPASDHTLLRVIAERVKDLRLDIKELKDDLASNYVTQSEFWPVKTIVYGGAGLILVAVVGALVALVIRQ